MRPARLLALMVWCLAACVATPTPSGPDATPPRVATPTPAPPATDAMLRVSTPTPAPPATDTMLRVSTPTPALARSQRLAFLAGDVRANAPALSFLLAVEAWQNGEAPEARRALLDGLRAEPQWLSRLGAGQTSLGLSPDGALAATGGAEGTITLWTLADWHRPTRLAVIAAPAPAAVTQVVFRPDGQALAALYAGEGVRFWALTDPAQPRPLGAGLSAPDIDRLAFRPDGAVLMTADASGNLTAWAAADLAAPAPLGPAFNAHLSWVEGLAFRPDGRVLATAGGPDDTVRLWDLADPAQPRLLSEPPLSDQSLLWVNHLAFSPDGARLFAARAHSVVVWEVGNPAAPRRLAEWRPAPEAEEALVVYDLALAPDGARLASAWSDGVVRVIDVAAPAQPAQAAAWSAADDGGAAALAYHPDGARLVTLSAEGAVTAWALEPPADLAAIRQPLPYTVFSAGPAAYSADGAWLALNFSADAVSGLVLWSVADPRQPAALTEPLHPEQLAVAVAFSPDRRVMAVGGYEGPVTLWEVSDSAYPIPLADLPEAEARNVWALTFSPDGRQLVTAAYDGQVLVWEVANPAAPRRLAGPLPGFSEGVEAARFLADGHTLAALSWDDALHFWDLTDPAQPQARGAPLGSRIASFAVHGHTLVTGHEDGLVRFWDLTDPAAPAPLGPAWPVGGEAVRLLGLSADGRVLALGLESEASLQLWEVSDPRQPVSLGAPLALPGLRGLAANPVRAEALVWALEAPAELVDLEVTTWLALACQRAGRNLTSVEWARYLGDLPYRRTCPQWPAGE